MRDNRAYLCHISEAIQTIESYIAGHTFEQFQTNKMMIDAVVRELEIIGEAANQISDDLRAPSKMNLHSNGSFCFWTASGSIDHPQMACFAFLARNRIARSRCDDHFVRGSKRKTSQHPLGQD